MNFYSPDPDNRWNPNDFDPADFAQEIWELPQNSPARRADPVSDLGDTVTAVFTSDIETQVSVTVTDRTMTVVSHGDIHPDQWAQILSSHDLLDAVIETVDYQIEDYPEENPAQTWRFTFGGECA